MLKWLNQIHQNVYVRNFFKGLLQPLKQLSRALAIIRKSVNTQKVLKQTVKSSAPVLVISFSYYRVFRPSLLLLTAEDSYQIWLIDLVVSAHLARRLPRFFVEDAINTISFVDAATRELPLQNKHFDCLRCDPVAIRHANFKTNIYYPAYSLFLFLLSYYPYVGKLSDWFLTPWLIGQTLLDYRLNMCDDHRYQLISENNAWLIGVGTLMKLSISSANYILGSDSHYSVLALQVLIIKVGLLMVLLQEEPLPGKEYSIDLLYYPRVVATQIIQDNVNRLHKYIIVKSEVQKTGGHIPSKEINAELQKCISKVAYHLLGKPFSELNTFVQTDAMRVLIQLKENSIKTFLHSIEHSQKYPYMVFAAAKIINILPKSFLPSGVSKEEIRFFKKVIYLNGVKKSLPIIASLVNHALKNPAELRAIEQKQAELLAREEEANKQQNSLVEKWGDYRVQEEKDGDDFCCIEELNDEQTVIQMEAPSIHEAFFSSKSTPLQANTYFKGESISNTRPCEVPVTRQLTS